MGWLLRPLMETFIWVTAPTVRMAKELYAQILRILPDGETETALLLVVEEEAGGYRDEGFNFLQTLAQSKQFEDVRLLGAVDACIAFLLEAWDAISAAPGDVPAERTSELLQWLTLLLSDRHLYVDGVVYSAINDRMQAACKRLRVVVSTSSQLIKVNGRVSSWASCLAAHRRLLLLQDEFQLMSFEEVAASAAPFDAMVEFGDVMQAPWNPQQQVQPRQPGTQVAPRG